MEKLKMHSPNLTQDNIARIRDLFPSCVTEATVKHVYFVAETKGSMSSMALNEIEKTKITGLSSSCSKHLEITDAGGQT